MCVAYIADSEALHASTTREQSPKSTKELQMKEELLEKV